MAHTALRSETGAEAPADSIGDARQPDDGISWRTVRRIAFVALLLIAVRLWVLETMSVSSISMEPNYHDGDTILVQKVSDWWGSPGTGDVVVLRDPLMGEIVVKRVVAVAGDTVEIYDGVFRRNGSDVIEPFADHGEMAGRFFGPETVPAGHVWVLGDNRDASNDSRDFGAVPHGNIVGRVIAELWG